MLAAYSHIFDTMSSCSKTLMGNYIQLPMSSALMNLFNFLLFDILLATVLFWITGTIAGLENSKSARRQVSNQLFLRNPPLIGVGLTCTRRNVFRWLALARVCGMAMILSTNFLIEGISCEVETAAVRSVVVAGKVPETYQFNSTKLREYVRLRMSCQGRCTDSDSWYYGELRIDEKANTKSCELRKHLVAKPIIRFGLTMDDVTVPLDRFKSCKMKSGRTKNSYHTFSCADFGTVACKIESPFGAKIPGVRTVGGPSPIPKTHQKTFTKECHGIVRVNRTEYTCSGAALFPGRDDFIVQKPVAERVARCRRALDIDVSNSDWIPLLSTRVKFRDAVTAVHGAGRKKMRVKVESPQHTFDVSHVHIAWFALFGVFSMCLLLLIGYDCALRFQGYSPSAHNEIGLGSLLANSANISTQRNRTHRNFNTFSERNFPDEDSRVPGPDLHIPLMVGLTNDGVLRARTPEFPTEVIPS